MREHSGSHTAVVSKLLVALVMALAATASAQVGSAQGAPMDSANLPVTRVVLFTNGVGYFEHDGTVTGDQVLDLVVAPDEMDDLLQSLVLQDLDGGSIEPVRYDSRDPLGRILGSYSIDMSGNPTLAQILVQARGESVRVNATQTIEGVIVSVERVDVPEEAPRTYLTLATSTGLRRIDLAEVSDISFANERLNQEMADALAAIARYRTSDATTVSIRFTGTGERRVRIGYVREMPVWKSSYRLVVNDDGTADLQGWAILDNPTDMDLVDVNVAFVAGQPISFITSLFDPVYVARVRVEPETATALAPTADDAVIGGALARQSMAAAPAPSVAMEMGAMADSFAPQLGGAGVSAQAQGARSGATFAYSVSEPVTVGRHQSAMIPIVQQTISAHSLSLFDQNTLPLNPLAGVRIVNDTGLHLAAGTVTIYDGTGFAGNALMSDLVPGDSRVLAYAVDLELVVDQAYTPQNEQIVSARIVNGLLESTVMQRLTYTVTVAATTEERRLLAVDLPRHVGYEVVSPTPGPVVTTGSMRFGVLVNADVPATDSAMDVDLPVHLSCDADGDPCVLVVQYERVSSRTMAVSNLDGSLIAFYLEGVELDSATRATLVQIQAAQAELSRLSRAIAGVETTIGEIHEDQARIRNNMNSLDRNASLYRRYVADLEAQEGELDELGVQLADLREEQAAAQQALDTLLRGLAGD
ncbi:MAG TPA: hypothetical protein VFN03_04250 [Trueperaceae bacterium]|nr:hypothetical protein [Trueperaceae bacterium]